MGVGVRVGVGVLVENGVNVITGIGEGVDVGVPGCSTTRVVVKVGEADKVGVGAGANDLIRKMKNQYTNPKEINSKKIIPNR